MMNICYFRFFILFMTSVLFLNGCKTTMTNEDYRAQRYPVDGRNFSPVDKYLANAPLVTDDEEGALNPYVLKVIEAYPTDGSYPYRCIKAPEYDLYMGVTQDIYYKGRVVAKAHPNNTRCSYCCGLTFEIFVRAMKERNMQKGLDPDDFNGMSFFDLHNLLQLWYIEGEGDSPQRGIELYGLGKKIENWEEAKAGDFLDFSRNNGSGHSVIFIEWARDDAGKINGFKYFSSNSRGVGYITEYFADSGVEGGKVLKKWFRLARVGSVENYKPFDRTKIPIRRTYAP
jgi:hypothetical protein